LTGKPLPQKLKLKYLHRESEAAAEMAESLELGGAIIGSIN
jgi:hypothetical protein